MRTRFQQNREEQRKSEAKDAVKRVGQIARTLSRRTTSQETESDESLPDVFASFSSADLIRERIASMDVFEEEEEPFIPNKDDIRNISVAQQPSTSSAVSTPESTQGANQSSLLLRPFSYFWQSGDPQAAAPNNSSSNPEPQPQTASTPKD